MNKVCVCVDAMGGDEEPKVVLAGIEAALLEDPDLEVLVSGLDEVVTPFCEAHDRANPLVASQVIEMGDDPIQAVMKKRRSSIVLGCRAVKRGEAQGFFSAGSTGAVTGAATAFITPFKFDDGEKKRPIRPCITSALPNRAGGLTVLCDMGANPDVEPRDLVRFAQMGAAYAQVVCGISNPRVGLLSNGSEDSKGSAFTKACFPLFREQVCGFAGNCEGGDITSGDFDVVVCDGFAGNIALKSIEGAAKFMMSELKGGLMSSLGGKVAAFLAKKTFSSLKAKLSGDAKGGAVLLGVRGVVLIGHGATSAEAVKNGTLATAQAVRAGLVDHVAASMEGIF